MSVSETTLPELSLKEEISTLDALLLDIDESTCRVFHEIDRIVDTAENELFCVVTNHINEIFSQLLDSITIHKMEYQKSSESDTSDFGDIRNPCSQNHKKISCRKPRSKTVTENCESSKKSTCFKRTNSGMTKQARDSLIAGRLQTNHTKESTRVEDVPHENFLEFDRENISRPETPKVFKSQLSCDWNMNHHLSDASLSNRKICDASYLESNISLNTSIVRSSVLTEDIENQEIHQFQSSVATSVFSDGKKLREERPSLSSQQEEFGELNITPEFSTHKKQKISYENVLKPVNVWQRPSAMQKPATRMHFTNPLNTCNKSDGLTVILDAEKSDTPYKCPSNKPVYNGAKVPFQHGNVDTLIKLTLNANSEIEKEHSGMDDYIELNDNSLARELDREYKKVMRIEDFCNSPNRIIEVIENGLHGDPVESQCDVSTTSFKMNLDISTTQQNGFQDSVELSKYKVVSLPHQEQFEAKTTQLSSVENYDATQEPLLLPKTVPGSSVELVNRIKNNNCQETSALKNSEFKKDCHSYTCNALVSSQLNISSVLQGTTALQKNSFTKETEHYVENTKFQNLCENLGEKVSMKSLETETVENEELVTLDEIQLTESGNVRSVPIEQYTDNPQFANETTVDTDVCISLYPTVSTTNFANNSILINNKPQTEGHLESINDIPFEKNIGPASVVASSFEDQIVPKNKIHKNSVCALKPFKRSFDTFKIGCDAFRNEAIKIPANCNSSTQNSSCNSNDLDFNKVGVHTKFSKKGCQNQNSMLNSTKIFTESKQYPANAKLLAGDENIICISDTLSASSTAASSSANEILLLYNNNITSCEAKTADNFRKVSNSSGVSASIQSITKNVTNYDFSCNKNPSVTLYEEGSYIKLPVDICNKNIESYSGISNRTNECKNSTDFTPFNSNSPLTAKKCQKVITNPAEGDCRSVSSGMDYVFRNYNLLHDKKFALTNFGHANIPKSPTDGNNANTTNNFNMISIRGANEVGDSKIAVAKNKVPPNQHYQKSVAKSTTNYANSDLGSRSNIFSPNYEYISLDCLSSDSSLLENIYPTTELTDIPLPLSPGNESDRSINADTYCFPQESLCDSSTNICPTTKLTYIPLLLSRGNESDRSIKADAHCIPQESVWDGNTNICTTIELTDIPVPLSRGNESDRSIKADTYCVPQTSLCDSNTNICRTTELTDIPLPWSPGHESNCSIKVDIHCVPQENLCDGNTNICTTTELTDIQLPLSPGNESDCNIKADKACIPQEILCARNTNRNIYPTIELTDLLLLPSPVNESDCTIMVDAQQSLYGSNTNTQNAFCKSVKQIDNTKGLQSSKCYKSELKDNSPKECKQISSLHNNEPLKGINIINTQATSNNNSLVIVENPVSSTPMQKLELPHISSKIGNHYNFTSATKTSVNVPNCSIDVISPTTITSTFTKEKNYTITSGEYEKGSKEFSNTCLKETTNSADAIASNLLTNAVSTNTTCVTKDISVPKYESSVVKTNSRQSSTTVSVPVTETLKSNETERDINKPASKTTGVKRPAPTSDNDYKSSKKYKSSVKVVPDKQNYSKAKETTYTNDPRWSLYNFSRPEDCFEVVRNQWCCSYLPNPHEDLTCRFSDRLYPFSSNFIIPGNSHNNTVECLAVYDDQINAVKCEMETLKNDLDLYGPTWNNRRIRQTIDRLNKLRDIHTQLLKAHEEAYHFYKYYQDPRTGWNARYISDYKRNEVKHQLHILNSYESFYGFC